MNTSVTAQKLSATGPGLYLNPSTPGNEKPKTYDDDYTPTDYGQVQALAEYKGELYATGNFIIAGDVKAANIARWNGTAWAPVGTGLDGIAAALCVFNDELYVAGYFKSAGGVAAKHIAKWNGSTWSAVGNIGIHNINALVVYKGELYAGGAFAEEENTQANVFKWNGKAWLPLKTKHHNDVFALAVYNNELYAGGTFLPNKDSQVMRWNGKTWSDAGVELSGAVSCFVVHEDKLYAGGHFMRLNNTPSPFIVHFDGKQWHHTVKGLGGGTPKDWVSTLTVYAGHLYTGGHFTTGEENKLAKNLSVLKPETWSPVVYDLQGSVYTMAVYKNALYIGGNFSFADGTTVSHNIAKIE